MDAKTQEMLVGLAKDWLAGGVSAGVSKTAVAPIGEHDKPETVFVLVSLDRSLRKRHRRKVIYSSP
jgi:hypothetical protein